MSGHGCPPIVIDALDAVEMSECLELLAGWLKSAERRGLLGDEPTAQPYDVGELLSDLARYSAILTGGDS